MKASVLSAFKSFSTKFEGALDYMYTDVKGLVTTGIGNLIDPMAAALVLPWKRSDGGSASQDEISTEWQRVKDAWPDVQSVATRSITTLHLDPKDIDWIVSSKAAQNEDTLRKRYPDYDNWPADAQLGLLSMAWAMGPAFNFPRFAAAANAYDFRTAAVESHMNDVGNPGLVPRNAANVVLFNNAATVLEGGGDREALYWPSALVKGAVVKKSSVLGVVATIGAIAVAASGAAWYFFRGRA